MAEHQGLAIGDLAAGLAPHGVLAAVFGFGQGQFAWAERRFKQPLPLLKHCGGGFARPLSRGGEVPDERGGAAPGRQVNAHVVGQAQLLTQGHKQPAGHPQAEVGMEHPQGQGIGIAQGHGGDSEQQHQLFGVLFKHGDGLAAAGGQRARLVARSGRGPGKTTQGPIEALGQLGGQIPAGH